MIHLMTKPEVHYRKVLLTSNSFVLFPTQAKETALHVASRYGHTNAVALLCRCCTDVNLPDEHGETALHIGVWHGFPKIVDTLCNFAAKTNLRNKVSDMTVSHFMDNMLTKYQMIKFIDFCEVWFLPESVSRVAAIVGYHRCHTPRH
ncbi:hypothetical protein TNCV_878981 [Trichonephila clavipes]|nr:hypothetical protein TNCV_878981 [Trichonephila clavipes]